MSGFMSRVTKRATNAYQSSVHGTLKWRMLSGGRQGWKMSYQDSDNKTGLAATSMRPGNMSRKLWCMRTECGALKALEPPEPYDPEDPCDTCEPVSDINILMTSGSATHYSAHIQYDLPACITNILGKGLWCYLYEGTNTHGKHAGTIQQSPDSEEFQFNSPIFQKGLWYTGVIQTVCLIDGVEHTATTENFYMYMPPDP